MFGWLKRRAAARPAANDAAAADGPAPGAADALLRRLEFTVLRRLDGLLQGDYRTLFRGFGLDLADLREYQPHDDVRYIDWNVTARTQVPHVREFQEDREIAAWFVVDLSGSVDFGSGTRAKRALAVDAVAVLARLFVRNGNRVGAVLQGAGPAVLVPARGGRLQVLQVLQRLLTQPAAPAGGLTDLSQLVAAAQSVIRRRSVVFVLSDFISTPGWGARLGQLARRHEVVALRLTDPLERALPDLGLVTLQDAETGEQLRVDTHDPALRRRFAQAAQARDEALRSALAEAGVDALELATDVPLDRALLHFAQLRKRRSRLVTGGTPAVVG